MENDKIFFDMFISFNDDKTEAYVNIRPNSSVDRENLKESIKEAFLKIKASLEFSGITHGIIPDEEIIEKLKEYCSLDEKIRKSQIYSFLIAKGTPPINGEDSKIIEHVKLKREKHGIIDEKTGRIDHRNLGFSERIVPKGKKIITIIKPTKGIPGTSVLGETIEPVPGKLIHSIKFDKNSIIEEENEKEINYIAKKEGFLYHDNRKGYFIDEKVLTKAVDFNIGNIEGKEIKDSTVVVKGSSDVFEDSVKAGFKVEASKIKINGNVGIEAKIIGDDIEINGVVDKKAVVIGKYIKINKFFGEIVKGDFVYIKEISNSKANSNTLIVKNSLSSRLIGSEIVILNDSRGSEIISDKFVYINRLTGGAKQKIKIDPFINLERKKRLQFLKDEQKRLTKDIKEIEKEIVEFKRDLSNVQIMVERIINETIKFSKDNEKKQREIVFNLIKNGKWEVIEEKLDMKFKPDHVYYFKQFQRFSDRLIELENEKNDLEENLRKINDEINEINTIRERAIIIINEIRDSIVEIDFDGITHIFKKDIIGPWAMRLKNGKINVDPVTREKALIIKKLEGLLSEDAYNIVKKLL